MTNTHVAKYPIQSLSKALNILKYLASYKNNNGAATLAEISNDLKIGRSNAHRLIDTLVEHNYVERCENPISYRLGWEAYHIGCSVLRSHSIASADFSIVDALCTDVGETVTVSVRNSTYALILYLSLPSTALRAQRETGYLEPLHATAMGKVLLCEMSPDEVRDLLGTNSLQKFTENTITEVEEFIKTLTTVKETGMAFDMEECDEGLKCVAFPIRDYESKIVASISVTMPVTRFTSDRVDEVIRKLSLTADKLSKELGYSQ